MTQTEKLAAFIAQKAAYAAADAQYDIDLDAHPRSDRAAERVATVKYEAALAAARDAYNRVMFPGVFTPLEG